MIDVTMAAKLRCADTSTVTQVEEAFASWIKSYIELHPEVMIAEIAYKYLEDEIDG